MTFEEAAEHCIVSKKPEWKNVKHTKQWSNTFKTYAYPVFGKLPISELSTDLVLKALDPIWLSKTETASRIRQRIETVFIGLVLEIMLKVKTRSSFGHLDKLLANPTRKES